MPKGFGQSAEFTYMRAPTKANTVASCSHISKPVLTLASLCLFIASNVGSSAIAQSGTYKHLAADGTVTFSDAPIRNGQVVRTSYKVTLRKPVAANPCRGLSTAQLDAKGRQLDRQFAHASAVTGVDATLLKAVARAESCFDPAAVSRAGAQGLMQLMPATARDMGVSSSFNGEQNLAGGARYLAAMLARYGDDLDLALAAYNAGPGNVDRYDGVPPFKETQKYIVSVRAFREHYRQQQS